MSTARNGEPGALATGVFPARLRQTRPCRALGSTRQVASLLRLRPLPQPPATWSASAGGRPNVSLGNFVPPLLLSGGPNSFHSAVDAGKGLVKVEAALNKSW